MTSTQPTVLRVFNAVLLVVYWIFAVVTYTDLPDRLPVHFTLTGEPTRFEETTLFWWMLLPAISSITFLLMIGLEKIIRSADLGLLNFPNMDALILMPEKGQTSALITIHSLAAVILQGSATWMIALFAGITYQTWLVANDVGTHSFSIYLMIITAIYAATVIAVLIFARQRMKVIQSQTRTE